MGEFAASIERSKAKSVSASGGAPLTSQPGALPLNPAEGASPPDPRYRLALYVLAMPPFAKS